ncbi:MAG: hypothetical protein QXX17_03145 [Conexivisphaerales archaeon]
MKREGSVETTDPAGGKATVPVFSHDDFLIGGVSLGRIMFLVLDLTGVERALQGKLDFIIGLDLMLGHRWTLHSSGQILKWW